MSALRLAPHIEDAFAIAVPLLSTALPESRLILSGGSVLQAHWRHRISTDLDFFIPRQALGYCGIACESPAPQYKRLVIMFWEPTSKAWRGALPMSVFQLA